MGGKGCAMPCETVSAPLIVVRRKTSGASVPTAIIR